ncbi:RNA polymerase sigma-70 factor [Flavobacterium pectinovorum]|uniref:RNA polymerase sigma-70 factor n=1 Tax=Flavobacterium pectinovorum TaxID=29533 RepID=UPI001FABCBC0|nr:RNA polymerase sigma-70 factor [Flavobacterium pectinovorum]MCI9846842.1 RNA polymerase sigma-70 factor [Flavobacterium pectinovorum]
MHKLTLKEYNNVFKKQYPTLCTFSNTYIDNLEVSKDIVQEVFIKIWEDQIEFQDDNTIKSYLYTSVKNKSLNYLKSKQFKATESFPSKDIAELETDPFYFREVAISETVKLVEKAVNTLPAKCALIIKLSLQGLTNAEIAEELGLTLHTIKAQKKIAYKRLKPLLKESFVIIAFVFEINN